MNQFAWWKNLLIVLVCVIGALYALPNVFGEDPAVQISATRAAPVDQNLIERVGSELQGLKIQPKTFELENGRLLVRLTGTDDQLRAADRLGQALGNDYIVALNLAPATPQWLRNLRASPMFLGLDLRGGVHFLMEVDMKAVVKQLEERYQEEIRTLLRTEKIRYNAVGRAQGGGVKVSFRDGTDAQKGLGVIREKLPALVPGPASSDGTELSFQFSEKELADKQ
ncbi:MAG TPA: protein translocase subunit SecD, partial [Plasticicumulans sp.]|nr:protein translocase subunit SecD [Plasticicumulans sp.]